MKFLYGLFISLAFLGGIGCSKTPEDDSAFAGKPAEEVALIKRGKAVYTSVCSACHNIDPKLDGALGPAVFGSSKELLEARILRTDYPAGYKPKRETWQMVALPQFKNDIPAIHAYLNFTH